MKACPAFIAALPREVSAFVKGWSVHRPGNNLHLWSQGNAVVVCAGMGAHRAALAVEAALAAMPVTHLISVGLAGACDPALHAGAIVHATTVIDSATGERFATSVSASDLHPRQVVVTGTHIASIAEKARLHASYGAAAVDMEAATVARLARAHSLGFTAIKTISDTTRFELEALGRFATQNGQFRQTAFALHTTLRPHLWHRLHWLARDSRRATSALTTELHAQLNWYRQQGS